MGTKLSDTFGKMRRIEGRVANDQDLKLSDCLRYHMRDTNAAKDLLYRRLRCLANYEKANKDLDMARARNKDVALAENKQQEVCSMFESLSKTAQAELEMQKGRRVTHFQKSLQELAELEVKHAKAHANAEADNKCHQDRGVRLRNGPYSASNELEYRL